jgi:hypothetical protein
MDSGAKPKMTRKKSSLSERRLAKEPLEKQWEMTSRLRNVSFRKCLGSNQHG